MRGESSRLTMTMTMTMTLLGLLASGFCATARAEVDQRTRPSSVTNQFFGPDSLFDGSAKTRRAAASVSLLAGLFGAGVGARYTHPVIHEGLIDVWNDSLQLEGGASVSTYSLGSYAGSVSGTALALSAEAHWYIHYSTKLSTFAGLGLGYQSFSFNAGPTSYAHPALAVSGPYVSARIGARYAASETIDLRLDLEALATRIGIGVAFSFDGPQRQAAPPGPPSPSPPSPSSPRSPRSPRTQVTRA